MSEHLSRLELADYLDHAEDVDRVAVAEHLASCSQCRETLDDLQQLAALMKSGEIFRHADEEESELDADRLAGWESLLDENERAVRAAREADAFFLYLTQQPVDAWDDMIANHPESCTGALVQRLIDAATPELDRKPELAMVFLGAAEVVAFALSDADSRRGLGHVWKQRSNALRMLGRYEASIDAAIMAENYYASLSEPDAPFEVGQARYTMAVTLFKMTRYPAALQSLASSRAVLEPVRYNGAAGEGDDARCADPDRRR